VSKVTRMSASTGLKGAMAIILMAGAATAMAQGQRPQQAQQSAQQPAAEPYEPGPDSKSQPGVPVGTTFEFVLDQSKIYPGTRRTIKVYVPAQYRAEQD